MSERPIGIMDSGIGGLTVYQEIIRQLPNESTIYIGDSRNTPYGSKHAADIFKFAVRMIDFLLQKDAKLIVIACNTITVSCIDQLRKKYPNVPIVGMVPVVKKAAEISKTKRIGILSTTHTAYSDSLQTLVEKFAADCTVFNHGTDTLVPLIEHGIFDGEEIDTALHRALTKFLDEDIDTLALGCTHFPFLKKNIQEIVGANVQVLDSGAAIARQVHKILKQNNALAQNSNPTNEFYTTGSKDVMQRIVQNDVQTVSL
jgi:glutamate racemase